MNLTRNGSVAKAERGSITAYRWLFISGTLSDLLATDFWIGPNSLPARLNRSLAGRFHAELLSARVCALNHVVPRSAAPGLYRKAHLFIFPTFSDGFGLTQLEGQSWKLPLITSRFCGDVVKDTVNGLLLPDISVSNIVCVLSDLAQHPQFAARTRPLFAVANGR